MLSRSGPTVAMAIMLTSIVVMSCSEGTPPTSGSTTTPPGSVNIPPRDQRGPRIVVDGRAVWSAHNPGCVSFQTEHRQLFTLVGTEIEQRERDARRNLISPDEHLRVVGYVEPEVTTVCGQRRPFRAEQITTLPP